MPTGYTAAIADGIDFKTYAMNCARAFGACIMLRDESGGGEKIPENFAPSDYHVRALEMERASLADVVAMTDAQCDEAAAKSWADREERRQKNAAECSELRDKYKAMLARVIAWNPPTADHTELKNFMHSQITKSIDFDCRPLWPDEEPKLTGAEWRAREVANLRRSIAYHERENEKEIERTDKRNAWIADLRKSLA